MICSDAKQYARMDAELDMNRSSQARHADDAAAPAACLLCGGSVHPTAHACGDRPDLRIGRCQECGLVRVMDFGHATESHYAADDYFPLDDAAIYAREAPWNVKRIERCVALLPEAASRKVLDFGCGIGGFLKRSQLHFARVVGFDLSKRLVEAHRAAGCPCENDLASVPADTDTIVLFHVLEHVPQPWLLVADLLKRFPAVDRVVVEVPHTGEALLSWFDSASYRLNHHSADHVYYFTPATLRAVLERAGLQLLVDTQLQRYTLGNTFGWLHAGRGGGQNRWTVFNEKAFHDAYEAALVETGVADSLFMIARPERCAP
jgi:SAM-dependent methyltransferase